MADDKKTLLENIHILRDELERHGENISRIPQVDSSSTIQEIRFNYGLLKRQQDKMQERETLHDITLGVLYAISLMPKK